MSDLKEWFLDSVLLHFGIHGLIVVLILGAAFYVYKNWATVKTWPGVATLEDVLRRRPVPKAKGDCFSVLVARLKNDHERGHEKKLIRDILDLKKSKEMLPLLALEALKGIEMLPLDRVIKLVEPLTEEMEKQGHKRALRYLKKSGGDVLIWGEILPFQGKTKPRLYWTHVLSGEEVRCERYMLPREEEFLSLPTVFWEDLTKILQLLLATGKARFDNMEGHYFADQLEPFIKRVQNLLEKGEGRPGLDGDARGGALMSLGHALRVLGEQSGQNEPLVEAVKTYHEALKEYTRDRVPLAWAMIQNDLGTALNCLGDLEGSPERLKEAVAAYQEALKERRRDRVPLAWAATQNNLGTALRRLGELEGTTERLKEAVAAYHEALKERRRDRVPLAWAATQNNLGNVLWSLGVSENCTARLQEAVAAFQKALKERRRDRVPLAWAMAQNDLGTALRWLGEREGSSERLKEAVAAYQEALKERRRDRVPRQWARTQNNLGNALWSLGVRENCTARLQEAVDAYREASKEQPCEKGPLDWARTQNNLGNALLGLGKREGCTARLQEAVAAFQKALEKCKRDCGPLQWAMTQNNLGNALRSLGEHEAGTERLEEAVAAYQNALEVFEETEKEHYAERTAKNLRQAEALLRERRKE